MSLDLTTMTRPELLELQKQVTKSLETVDKRARKAALDAAKKAAAENGFDLNDLVGGKVGTKAKPNNPAKYRDPDNADNTWSGRGRQPVWFKEKVAASVSLESMLIT